MNNFDEVFYPIITAVIFTMVFLFMIGPLIGDTNERQRDINERLTTVEKEIGIPVYRECK